MDSKFYRYYFSVALRENNILESLREFTKKHPFCDFQISPEQGQFMALLVKITQSVRYLEIGTFTGYSALAICQALPSNGEIITCDNNKDWTDIARKYWRKAGVDKKIDLRLANAKDTLHTLLNKEIKANYFDIAFIDADKINHDAYYEYCLQLVRPGGVILLDNVFRHKKVMNKVKDEVTQAVYDLNEKIKRDTRVDMCIVPISDGLTIIRKR